MSAASLHHLKERCHGLSVGVFAAPLGNLSDASRMLAGWGGRLLHFDVMDGVFVPSLTAGAGFVAALDDGLLRDVHLMVARPSDHVAAFAKAGADIITVHAEAPDAAEALAAVRQASANLDRPILAGLAVMPDTPLDALAELLDPMPDLILVLAVDPRTSRAPDVPQAAARLEKLREMTGPKGPLLAIDGGVTEHSIAEAAACAPDIVVSGSAIFRAADPETAFANLSAALKSRHSSGEARHVG